jgi:16S rRNA processing protein RimM
VSDDLIIVGEVARAHGIAGTVRVVPVTDFPEHLLALEHAVIVSGGAASQVRVERAQADGRWVLMKFAGIDTLEAAERLRGATLQIPASQAVPLPPGQFYLFQVVGLEVRTPEGRAIGRVVDVLRTGSNDVYVVRPPEGGPEIFLPAVDSCVEKIDPAAGELVARLPEWLR